MIAMLQIAHFNYLDAIKLKAYLRESKGAKQKQSFSSLALVVRVISLASLENPKRFVGC